MRLGSNAEQLPPKSFDALPDSTEPNGPCPRCGRLSNFGSIGTIPVTYDARQRYIQVGGGRTEREHVERLCVLQCHGCGQNVVVIEEQYVGGVAARKGGNSGAVVWRGIYWWPTPGMRPSEPDVPAPIADAVAEGTRCLAVRAPRAAVVMFRGVLGYIVTDRGSTTAQAKPNLAGQLKQMAADGDLDRTLAEWANHVRLIGNAGAHPNELDSVSIEEAEDLSRLMTALLEYLYVMPARIQRARSARS